MFDEPPDTEVVAAIGDSARAKNIACARRLAAIAELYERRQIPVEDGHGRELSRTDLGGGRGRDSRRARHHGCSSRCAVAQRDLLAPAVA